MEEGTSSDKRTTDQDIINPEPKRIALFEGSFTHNLLSALGLISILLVFRYYGIFRIHDYLFGSIDGDAGLYLWLSTNNIKDLFSLDWFEKYFFYPYGNTLAWSDNFLLPSLFALLLKNIGLSEVTSFNFIILVANFLNGFITYKLLYRLSGEVKISFSSGAAFMTSSYLTHQIGHPQLQFIFFIPLSLLLFFRFLEHATTWRSFLLGITLSTSFLTTIYYTYFSFLACLSILIGSLCLRPNNLKLQGFVKLVSGLTLGFIPLIPFIIPYLKVRDAFGGRGIYEAYYFSASLWSYLSSSPQNFLYQITAQLSNSESHLFPGFTLTAFTFAAIARLTQASKLRRLFINWIVSLLSFILFYSLTSGTTFRIGCSLASWLIILTLAHLMIELGRMEKRLGFTILTGRSLIALFFFLSTLTFLISLGPLANPEKGQFALTPYWIIYKLLPGFDSIRAISRSGVLVYFSFTILFGFALSRLTIRPAWQKSAFLPLAFVLVENFNTEFPLSKALPPPSVVSNLAEISSPGAVMVLPYAGDLDKNNEVISWSEFARINVTAMLSLKNINRPFVNGYSGQKTNLMRILPRELKDFPSIRAIRALSQISDLKYIIYYPMFSSSHDQEIFNEGLKNFTSNIKTLAIGNDGSYLFELLTEETINQQFEILIPPLHDTVLFELRSTFKLDIDNIKINIINNDDPKSNSFHSVMLKGDGSWQGFLITLPANRSSVRPFRIGFKSELDEGLAVRIRNIRLQHK